MPPAFSSRIKGTVTLVALCFVTVLGITLAGYIAVCSRAMTLSNRSFQARTSQQLAEMGIDEAMRAFNKNNWTTWTSNGITVTWDTTTYATSKRAVASITFPSGKFGVGVTGTVKIRVDNFDANALGSSWVSSGTYPAYRTGDLVGYGGTWYRCLKSHYTSQTPNGMADLTYWAPAPVPWTWQPNVSYNNYDVVNYNGTWYRCASNGTNSASWTGTNWTSIPSITLYNGATSYSNGDIVYFPSTTTWYRWNGSTWLTTAGISWQYLAASTYSYNDVVYYYNGSSYSWWRFINATPTSGITPGSNASYWENGLSGSMHGWSSSSINYNLGDAVYYSTTSQWYRCIRGHTSSGSITPSNTAYWANTPLYFTAWDSNKQYVLNDTVRYNGVWYISIHNATSNVARNPATTTSYWIGANTATTSYQWNASTAYAVGDYRCYGSAWYKCTTAHTGHAPNDTAYWTPTWANSFGVTTGAPVVYAEGTITIANNPSVTTQLRATIAPAPLFPNAAAATTTISANSGGTVDSYDSITDPTGSTRGYSAVVAAGNTSGTAVTLSSTTVKGYVAAPSSLSSPYAPLISIGSSASVKSSTSPASPNMDTSRVSRSPFIPQFDPLPSGGLTAAFTAANFPKGMPLILSATTNIGVPGATTPSRYYINGSLTLSSSSGYSILNINGPVILYINGDLTMDSGSPNGKINLSTTGSAEIHIAGRLTVNIGSDGINNNTQDPKKLIIICDTSASTAQNYSDATTSSVYGVFYLPNTTNASGLLIDNNNLNIYGAVSANKITYSGANMNVHYDTSLRYATFGGVDQPYSVTDWRELPVDEQATMP